MLRTSLKKCVLACSAVALGAAVMGASAADLSDGKVKIGVLGDMSGVYSSSYSGPGAVAAVKMAVEDFGGEVLGKPIVVISADHQNKPSVGASIARKWIDVEGVDMITDLTNSAVGLAVQNLASEKGVITINTGSASAKLTNEACTKYGIHYGYDTYAVAHVAATGIVQNGGDTWFIIYADYAFGQSLKDNLTDVVTSLGGKVVGSIAAPLGTTDFASYLIQAKASGAEVIALANGGQDTVNAVKQANAFGIVKGGQLLTAPLMELSTAKALGLEAAAGLQYTSAWYWNMDEASRKWTQRYLEYSDGAAPTFVHASLYSATTAYLNAVKAAGTDDSAAVRKQLGDMTIDDFYAKGGHIRPDGLMVHDMYLVEIKSPAESEGTWDLAKVVQTVPPEKAFPALSETSCPRVQ